MKPFSLRPLEALPLLACLLLTGARWGHAFPIVTTIQLNGTPANCAVNASTNRLYVTDTGRDVLFVLDSKTGLFLATTSLSSDPRGVAVDEGRNLVYIANAGAQSITVVDGATNAFVTNIGLGSGVIPVAIAFDPGLDQIFTANGLPGPGSVSVVNAATQTLSNSILFSPGSSLNGVAINPVTRMVWVTNTTKGQLGLINGLSSLIEGLFNVTGAGVLSAVAVDSVADRVYVTDAMMSRVIVADGDVSSGLSVLGTIPTGLGPAAVAVNETTGRVYTADKGGNTVTVIRSFLASENATVNVGVGPAGVAVNSVTNTVYEANSFSNDVFVIDGNLNAVNGTVSLRAAPAGIVYGGYSRVFLACFNNRCVLVIDAKTSKVIALIPVGLTPYSMAADLNDSRIFVTNLLEDTVTLIDPGTIAVTQTLKVGKNPSAVAVNDLTHMAYVTNAGDNTISVIDCTKTPPVVAAVYSVGKGPFSVAVNRHTSRVYEANLTSTTLGIYDGSTHSPLGSMLFSDGPAEVNVDWYGRFWVAESAANRITVLDGKTHAVVQTLNPGKDPRQIVFNDFVPTAYVVNRGQNQLVAHDILSFKKVSTTNVGAAPFDVAVWSACGYLYVSNTDSDTVTVIQDPTPIKLTAVTESWVMAEVKWNPPPANAPLGQYQLQRSECATCDWVQIAELPGDVPSYLDRDVRPGQTYFYRVSALYRTETGALESSNWSEVASVTIPGASFRRGDANGEGRVDLSDAIFSLAWQFSHGRAPTCQAAADANDDGTVNIGDPIFLLNWQFRGGREPPAPGPRSCGSDPTPDGLPGCDAAAVCSS